jgi:REP element-mobilizing transposase RayT
MGLSGCKPGCLAPCRFRGQTAGKIPRWYYFTPNISITWQASKFRLAPDVIGGFEPLTAFEIRVSQKPAHYSLMTYLVTFSTYGSHLPGDARGSADRHIGWRAPEPRLEAYAANAMRELAFLLNYVEDRRMVRDAIVKICTGKSWNLAALHIRSTHVHVVVEADVPPGRVLQALKAYATRALRFASTQPRNHYWTRSGDVRRLATRKAVDQAIRYVLDEQGEPMETFVWSDPPIHIGG